MNQHPVEFSLAYQSVDRKRSLHGAWSSIIAWQAVLAWEKLWR